MKWEEINHTHHWRRAVVKTPQGYPQWHNTWVGVINCPIQNAITHVRGMA